MARSRLRISIVLALAAATALALTTPAAGAGVRPPSVGAGFAAAAPAMTWSAPVLVDHQPPFGGSVGWTGVSCPTAGFCVAVGWDDFGVGYVATSTDPAGGAGTWSVVAAHIVDGSLPAAISCPTTSLCVAVDAGGDVIVSTDPTGGADAWAVASVSSAFLVDVSCPSASLCVAVDSQGAVHVSTNPTGGAGAWTTTSIEEGFGLTSVSCPSSSLCVVTDYRGNVFAATSPTGGSGAWIMSSVDGGHTLRAMECPTETLCVAADDAGNVVTSTDPTGGAAAWSVAAVTEPGTYGADLSCPSTSLCVLVEHGGVTEGTLLTSTNPAGGAGAWTSTAAPLSIVSCPTTSLCVGASGGVLAASTDPTGGATAWAFTRLGSGRNVVTGIWCPSPTLCVAVDDGGNVLTTTSPSSGGWSFAHVDGDPLHPVAFVAVACPTVSLCVAVDVAGNVFTSTDPTGGPGAWSGAHVDGYRFRSVACASEALCVAADSAGNVVAATDPDGGAGAWTVSHIDSASQGLNYLAGISCPSASLCVAVDGAGNVFTSTNPAGGSGAWSGSHVVGPGLLAVSCPTTSLCVAVGYAGTLVVLTDAGAATSTIDSGHRLSAVSCASAALCAATDDQGAVVVATEPAAGPTAWSPAPVDPVGILTAVSCPSTSLCVVGDDTGRIAVGRAVTPPTVSATSSRALDGTTTLTFSEDVHGISSTSVQLRVDATTTAVPVGYVCRDAAKAAVSCGGYVRSVSLTPTAGRPLVPGQYYRPYVGAGVTDQEGAGITEPLARFRASTAEQETSLAATYGWRKAASSLAYGGSYVVERAAGASATYTFSGPTITWYTATGPSQGYAYVYVDGVLKAKVNDYAGAQHYRVARTVSVGGAATASHTLRIVVAGVKGSSSAKDAQVVIDAVKVGSTLTQSPALALRWRTAAATSASGGRYATSDLAGAAVSFVFRGKSVTWWQVLGPRQGNVRVYVDGVLKATLSGYSSTTRVVGRTYAVPDAQHVIRIVVLGTHSSAATGTAVGVDRWTVA